MDLMFNDVFNDGKMLCNDNVTFIFDATWLFSIIDQCKTKCSPNCIKEIYNYEIKDVTDSPSMIHHKIDNNTIIIKLLPKDTEQYTYVHQPKITRYDFMSKLGGVLSLWLGFSFYTIYSHVEKLFRKLFTKNVSLNNKKK